MTGTEKDQQRKPLTKKEIARLMGVSTRTITTYMSQRGLPYHQAGPGCKVTFYEDEYYAWAAKNKRQ